MVPFRPASSQLDAVIAEGRMERTHTDGDLSTELWLSLHQLAEVEEVGVALLKKQNPARETLTAEALSSEWRELRSYIRQAENFYEGASVLHWTSSPLNYYYSFLNLAKASCLLADKFKPKAAVDSTQAESEATPRRVRHGLFEKIIIGDPDRWTVRVDAALEVFSLYYSLSLGLPIPANTVLEVHDLLGYSLPIGWQLRQSGYAERVRAFSCRWSVLLNATETWDLLGMPRAVPVAELPSAFVEQYEEVDPTTAKEPARVLFGCRAIEAGEMRFFQRRLPYPLDSNGQFHGGVLLQDFKAALPHGAFPNLSDGKHQFVLCLPCPVVGGIVPMNTELATYACWFFLSSLVRYHPDYMESIAKSNDAWLIESFVKSSPLDILRALTARILGYSLVMLRT